MKRLVSIKEACKITSLSRTAIFLKVKRGEFPKPVRLSENGVRKAFVAEELDAWIEARIAARDNEEAA